MLSYGDYISDMPDIPHGNFARLLEQVSGDHADRDAVLFRPGGQGDFTRWSFSRLGDECRRVARGLLAAGLAKGDRAVLWAENRPEWTAVWMGAVIAGIVIVPVDFLVPEDECLNIVRITRARAFFYSGKKREFARSLPGLGVEMAASVCISPGKDGGGAEFYRFGEGAEATALPPADSIEPDHPASVVFTSGTTGFAKGVTLSHRNIIANASAAIQILEPNERDVFIAVLPLHHTYSTTCCFIAPVSFGIPMVIVERIAGRAVVNDVRDSGVTFLIGVPLLFDKMMAALNSGYNTGIPKILRAPLNLMRKKALEEANRGRPEYGQKKFLFFRRKAGLHSVRIMIAGGGPLNPKTADFFDSLGFNMVHGYGMSENSPLISVNTPGHRRNVSVGLPVSRTEIKILEPNAEGIGEIAVASPSVMLGYFEDAEATEEVIREIDGKRYLLTGDLGYRDGDGFLYIMGRRKNLIVSSGGKNIHPEEIEVLFGNSRVVSEIMVVGRRDRGGEQVFAVMVPNYEAIGEDHPGKENDEAFVRELVKNLVADTNRGLPGYKKISDFALRGEPFEKNAQQKIKRFLYRDYENP